MEYNSELVIIREIFEGANELFENELERAFDIACQTIVIEPSRLGEETARWIRVGNYLQRISIVSGLGSMVTGAVLPNKPVLSCSLLATSLLSNTIHTLSWQLDPCASYTVESDPAKIQSIITNKFADNVSLVTSTEMYTAEPNFIPPTRKEPVVLLRRSSGDIQRSNWFKAAVSLIALAFSMWNMFKSAIKFAIV